MKYLLILAMILSNITHSNLMAKPRLKIGVQDFSEYLPYSRVQNGQYSGFNRQLLDRFAELNDFEFSYIPMPIKRLYHEFLNTKVDLKYPDSSYWSKSLKDNYIKNNNISIYYSDPIVSYTDGLMVLPKNVKLTKKNLGKNFKSLGIIAGFTPFAYLNHIKNKVVEVHEVNSYEGLLNMVISGRIHGAYSNIDVTKYYLDKVMNKKNALIFAKTLPHTNSTRHLSSIKHPDVIKKFNHFLSTQTTWIMELKRKHGLATSL